MKNPWVIEDRPPISPGCFVIPSYALKNHTQPTRPTRAQIELAYLWWRKFPQAKMILSTGDNQRMGITNARVMADFAASLGVPRTNLIEEDQSRDTYQNLAYSWDIIKRQGFEQPTLVTHAYYTRRAVATARKMGWQDFYWLSAYSQGESGYGHKWLQTHSRMTIFLYEILAMVYSKVVGWV